MDSKLPGSIGSQAVPQLVCLASEAEVEVIICTPHGIASRWNKERLVWNLVFRHRF